MMENLTVTEAFQNVSTPPLGPSTPPPPQLLPVQMFTTAAQLLDLTDKKLMVALRDGRKLIGILRSWDQFANLVLQSTKERLFVPPGLGPKPERGLYADKELGVFLFRGENILLLGEVDLDRDDLPPPGYDLADIDLVQSLVKKKMAGDKKKAKIKMKKLSILGFEAEHSGEVLL